jgi:hypothetical protein
MPIASPHNALKLQEFFGVSAPASDRAANIAGAFSAF